ncbi:1-acyl-sn-glycerol-3-phosphate acyltransferase [Thioalkalivibrio denitrificans]|uniref:1-acyl-sn-glycerol-3-phosphate acyltransferase n=2 Tax=Thioalkalivibrio denitrificans TaxID=108003 RepID=A0A1V3NDK5_9GAMM|nr:1-acyl-sn-glycerol-3-phosphate acyltransferase [Thioalkalivibrio denitrificans]
MRAALFWLGFAPSTVLFAVFGPLTLPLSWHGRYRIMSQWTRFNVWWLGVTCGLKYEVKGREHLEGEAGVLLCKHQSTWETIALQRFIPPEVYVLKRELMRIPFFGWGMAVMEPIAIDRGAGRRALEQLVEQGRDRLERGLWVVMFPEGTRVAPGTRGRYKQGGAVLAARTGRRVVPVAHNAGVYWPRHSFIKYPGTVRVEIGPPIEARDREPDAILRDVEAWIESRQEELDAVERP